MSYIEDNLISGERILYRTRLHWKLYVPSACMFVLTLGAMALTIQQGLSAGYASVLLIVPVGMFGMALLKQRCSEFGVTDKRVLIKTGIFDRHTLETLLTKVENIGVEQSLWGRLFNYGTLYVTGTGSTKEVFPGIQSPLEFRKELEAAAVAFEERRPSVRLK